MIQTKMAPAGSIARAKPTARTQSTLISMLLRTRKPRPDSLDHNLFPLALIHLVFQTVLLLGVHLR
jgi:hypothetical protein